MRVAVGSDHAGFDLKEILKAELTALAYDVSDLGTDDAVTSVDYPDYGAAVGRAVATGEADFGICVCGSGNGIAMAANKVSGVRAAVVHDVTTAALAGQHNHANVVCFGARTTGTTVVIDALHAFLAAPKEPPERSSRHLRRIEKLAVLDESVRNGADVERELVHHTAHEGTT
ncbi:MAG TPA: RpiB/LacA/LacB family sugar-phosphate isomerase [Acidimicrobiales bacterium]|jgi:ribose 5-phosphate isomerase B|nr:RpiB/LacA/LacB family sugar-phosphate isomerase [Acidimicrobiales bacterium]